MSFPENDRKTQSKSGKTFPDDRGYNRAPISPAIADALRAEFGRAGAAVKVVARLTDANERTVRNWFEGKNAPSGENLIVLIHHSDAVLETVLGLSRRSELLVVGKLDSLRTQLEQVVVALGELKGR